MKLELTSTGHAKDTALAFCGREHSSVFLIVSCKITVELKPLNGSLNLSPFHMHMQGKSHRHNYHHFPYVAYRDGGKNNNSKHH